MINLNGYNRIGLCSCEAGLPFAEKVKDELNKFLAAEEQPLTELVKVKETHFANTEVKVVIEESIRGRDMFIIQDVENSVCSYSVPENLDAIESLIDAAYRSSAARIVVILPVFPYARQDKTLSREGVSAERIAKRLELAGADRVITLDIHNLAIAGFFKTARFENLNAAKNIIDWVKGNLDLNNLIVVSPDVGGTKRANEYAIRLGKKLALVYKERDYSKASTVDKITVLGDVAGKDILLVDDMIDTAGTMIKTVRELKDKHKVNNVYLTCSLPLFNGPAIERLNQAYSEGYITRVIGTDAVHHGGEDFLQKNPWYKEVSVSKYFARVIYNLNRGLSISRLLE